MENIIYRKYKNEDELSWLTCRYLSFRTTAYFDDIINKKEKYNCESIEYIAEYNKTIIGLIDLEIENVPCQFSYKSKLLSARINHIATHPNYINKGIATQLLKISEGELINKSIKRIEAWTRDDIAARNWYIKNKFIKSYSYYHVYADNQELKQCLENSISKNLRVQSAFFHYTGSDIEAIRNQFKRIHECVMYEKIIK